MKTNQANEVTLSREQISRARTYATEGTMRACRAIEKALKRALAGENIRGLKNLGSDSVRIYAAHLRTQDIDAKIEKPRRAVQTRTLCLDPKGNLIIVARSAEAFATRLAEDDDLVAADAEALARALPKILSRHLEAAKTATKNYERLGALAARVLAVLDEEGEGDEG